MLWRSWLSGIHALSKLGYPMFEIIMDHASSNQLLSRFITDPGLGAHPIGVSFDPRGAADVLAHRLARSKFLEIETDE